MPEKKSINTITFKNPATPINIAFGIVLVAGLLMYAYFTASTPKAITEPPVKLAIVTITPTGFIPSTLSIATGTKVVWKNADANPHQLQSNPHPTGDSLPGLKSEILLNAQTYSYAFTKSGSFTYHDYLNPTTNGVIEVHDAKTGGDSR
ncbi:MAG TPA: hypothetical protein VF272_03175 [Candidatus Saccharimonadia bacterium]